MTNWHVSIQAPTATGFAVADNNDQFNFATVTPATAKKPVASHKTSSSGEPTSRRAFLLRSQTRRSASGGDDRRSRYPRHRVTLDSAIHPGSPISLALSN
jgi:hypothetical protein